MHRVLISDSLQPFNWLKLLPEISIPSAPSLHHIQISPSILISDSHTVWMAPSIARTASQSRKAGKLLIGTPMRPSLALIGAQSRHQPQDGVCAPLDLQP